MLTINFSSQSTISTSAHIGRLQNDLTRLSTPIQNSISELKNDYQGIVKTIEQRSTQIISDVSRVDSHLSTLNQNVSTLGGSLGGSLCRLEQNMEKLPSALENRIEDKILTTLDYFFTCQAQSSTSQSRSVDTMVQDLFVK